MILTSLQKLPCNVGKIIVATGFEWLPKVQKLPDLVTLLVNKANFGFLFEKVNAFLFTSLFLAVVNL